DRPGRSGSLPALRVLRAVGRKGRMSKLSSEQALSALERVKGPELSSEIVSLGMISDVMISGGKVIVSITVSPERARELEPLRQAAEQVLRDLPEVAEALVVLPAERRPGPPATAGPGQSGEGRPEAPAEAVRPGVPGVRDADIYG